MPLSATSGAISACVRGGSMLASDTEWSVRSAAPMIPSATNSVKAGTVIVAKRPLSRAGMISIGCVRSFRSCSHLRENSQRDDLFDDAQGLDI